mgnify:CR=1 FL=1
MLTASLVRFVVIKTYATMITILRIKLRTVETIERTSTERVDTAPINLQDLKSSKQITKCSQLISMGTNKTNTVNKN